ncbi:C-type lectin domain family 6 member A-like [Clarias magur]|uniref:C-type lectin domain family 6 member A-like n=1 Tax=Clarias magur TaxID=1594786 RepID=A0A8J4TGT0_CLAMG|nr:C-type lectin domain family 6 member A-like [Clarias magur]
MQDDDYVNTQNWHPFHRTYPGSGMMLQKDHMSLITGKCRTPLERTVLLWVMDLVSSQIGETHWIGLNDLETEGEWIWVNNQPLKKTNVT